MNVASLENCKRLYELSGWDDTGFEYELYNGSVIRVEDSTPKSNRFKPAYTAGYLLRKLPHFIELVQLSGGYTPNGWVAAKKSSQDYWHKGGNIEARADTPEDALTLLAIKLFESGVLK